MKEIERRRTFAIISHPDAGKTTLTEKFLLFGGQIQVAGAVKNNKIRKTATSDWMDIEKQRGISVSTSVMEFDYLPDGEHGDPYKVNCTTCHQGQAKPLGGVSMLDQAPWLAQAAAAPAIPEGGPAAPTAVPQAFREPTEMTDSR